MRNIVRLFLLLFATLFAGGAYAQLPEAVGLSDEDNIFVQQGITSENATEHFWMNQPAHNIVPDDYAHLIDGDLESFIESNWEAYVEPNYLYVYLNEKVGGPMVAYIQRRSNKTNNHVTVMTVFGSNEESAKKEVTDKGWDEIATVCVSNPGSDQAGLTDIFYVEKPYKYFRFRTDNTDHPSRFWSFHMAEFGLYSLDENQIDEIQNNEEYAEAQTLSGQCGDNITWSLDKKSGLLCIEGSGMMNNYEIFIENIVPWYKYTSLIKSVQICDGVTSVGDNAFRSCSYLTSIEIPDDVTYIGKSAFDGCENLNGIRLPTGLTSIEAFTFNGCSCLENITIPDGVTNIGESAFSGCSNLKTIAIPDGIMSIEKNAFSGCGLNLVTIPDGVTNIGESAFARCSNLKTIAIPDGITSIGESAFYGCYGLSSIVLPESVTSIGDDAFNACGLKNVFCKSMSTPSLGGKYSFEFWNLDDATLYVPEGTKSLYEIADGWNAFGKIVEMSFALSGSCGENINWSLEPETGLLTISGNGEMYDYDLSNNLSPWYYMCEKIRSIQINEGVTSIGAYAFSNCSFLTSTDIPATVRSIKRSAFENDLCLSNIVIPEGIATIEEGAFRGCDALTEISLPNSLTQLGCEVFYNCENLGSIVIPKNITVINSGTFAYCRSLSSVTFPMNVEYIEIEYDAFEGCSSIKDVYCQCMTIPEDFPFHYCPIDEATLHVPYGMKELYEDEYGWEDFGSIVEDIEVVVAPSPNNEIWYTSEENKIISPYNTDAFDANIESFTYKDGMGVITFDRDVTNIGYEAFFECRDLKSIVIPNSVTCIGSDAFSRCENLRAITIPSSVTSIEWDAFEECRSLRNITIPSSVTYIDGHAFHLCGLTSINIPSSVANIGYGAFSGCNGLTSICVSPDNKAYDSRDNCNAIINSQTNELIAGCKNTVIPNSVTSIGEEAFYYCDLTSITIPNGVTSIGESAFSGCNYET